MSDARKLTATHALETFGAHAQIGQINEECCELALAARKLDRGCETRARITGSWQPTDAELCRLAEEGQDVALMLEQLRVIVGEDRWERAGFKTLARADQLIVAEQQRMLIRACPRCRLHTRHSRLGPGTVECHRCGARHEGVVP